MKMSLAKTNASAWRLGWAESVEGAAMSQEMAARVPIHEVRRRRGSVIPAVPRAILAPRQSAKSHREFRAITPGTLRNCHDRVAESHHPRQPNRADLRSGRTDMRQVFKRAQG